MCSTDSKVRLPQLKRRASHAFSLIEVIIVIVIIGVLVGAVSLSSKHFVDKAKVTRARSDLATFKSAIDSCYAEGGAYPTSEEGLASLTPKYIDKPRLDPWGHAYQYNFPGKLDAFEVICFGADGQVGGQGVDEDISSESLEQLKGARP